MSQSMRGCAWLACRIGVFSSKWRVGKAKKAHVRAAPVSTTCSRQASWFMSSGQVAIVCCVKGLASICYVLLQAGAAVLGTVSELACKYVVHVGTNISAGRPEHTWSGSMPYQVNT